jgi:ubiquinone/menaquinone biosynthesis C-methylase UbiE
MVSPLWCDIETKGGVKIADGSVDVAVMINTFFQLEEKYVTLSEVGRILRSGAKFFVIDWTDSFGGLGPAQDQIIGAKDTQAMAESSGFVFERTFDAGDHHYGLAFRKI